MERYKIEDAITRARLSKTVSYLIGEFEVVDFTLWGQQLTVEVWNRDPRINKENVNCQTFLLSDVSVVDEIENFITVCRTQES